MEQKVEEVDLTKATAIKPNENFDNEKDEITESVKQEKQLQEGIMLSLEIEKIFRAYAYRCLAPDNFCKLLDEALEEYGRRKLPIS